MKRRFSIGTALGAPFHLAGRRPLSVLVWGLLTLAPAAAAIGVMICMMGTMPFGHDLAAMDDAMVFDSVMLQMLQFQAVSGLLNILQIVVSVVVATAVIRATVRPGRGDPFFYLRLGMDELRVAVVMIALVVGLYLAIIVLGAIGVSLGIAVWSVGAPANGWAVAAIAIVGVLTVLLLFMRLSLIAPASVLHRDFAFTQGWALAKGQTLKLFGLLLLTMVVAIVIHLVVAAVVVGVLISVGAVNGFSWPHGMNELRGLHGNGDWPFGMPDWPRIWPWAAAATLPVSYLFGVFAALQTAPFASATRQLAGGDPLAPPPAAEPLVHEDVFETSPTAESVVTASAVEAGDAAEPVPAAVDIDSPASEAEPASDEAEHSPPVEAGPPAEPVDPETPTNPERPQTNAEDAASDDALGSGTTPESDGGRR